MLKKKNIFVFGKAQLSAFIGGGFDFCVMVFCKEVLHFNLKESIWISGLLGALVNFSLNKYWTYKSKEENLYIQLLKFFVVVLGSIALKSFGTHLLTFNAHLDYKISRLIVDLVVSLGYNYTLQKFWVFKEPQKKVEKKTEAQPVQHKKYYSKNREYQEA